MLENGSSDKHIYSLHSNQIQEYRRKGNEPIIKDELARKNNGDQDIDMESQTLRQFIKRYNRDKIVFLVGHYEIQIYRDKAVHNLAGNDTWTEIPMNYEIYVNDTNRFIQITTPARVKGDKIDLIFEYAGSIMV